MGARAVACALGSVALCTTLELRSCELLEKNVGQHREDERVVLLLFVVVRAAGELAETRVVCLRDGA